MSCCESEDRPCAHHEEAPWTSPWRTPEAIRTYVSGVLWLAGTALTFATGEPDVAGWLRVRLDAAGLILLAAALVGGWNFFPQGLRAVRRLRLDMGFLMTAATVGALLIGEPIEAGAIAFLFSLAELLERAAVDRARRSIEELVRLSPEEATLVGDGGEQRVAASSLRRGQLVRVRPGEKIPIDGRVVAGAAAVDQATVTGESVPIPKETGDPVFAGTLAHEGSLDVEATTDAGDTTLDRIVRLVREAQSRRTRVEHFVQRFARVYTPAVTALAVLVMTAPPVLGFGSGLEWFLRGLTLLVVACPCALVIATPVTVVSALTSATRHGVLIKGGEHLEALGGACAVAFDKTGTLTEGRLEVVDVRAADGWAPSEVLALAAAAEARSEHPIAGAIVAAGPAAGPIRSADGFRAFAGRGVTARVEGTEVRVGTAALFEGAVPQMADLERRGLTVVYVGAGPGIVGAIALRDRIRPESAAVVQRLRDLGFHARFLLTGDQEPVARSVGEVLGITEVRARLLPEQKIDMVRELRERHGAVVMVGDGVNDAPALAEASVGVAMGAAGSPATIETADVALMADDLRMLPYAVQLARRARHVVRFNIAFAVGIKVLLAAGAVLGVVNLLTAVLVGDMGASLLVTLNAWRLGHVGANGAGPGPHRCGRRGSWRGRAPGSFPQGVADAGAAAGTRR
jgi:Cd2+/Zn2+-exporting ATPase